MIYYRSDWGSTSDKGGYAIYGVVSEAYVHHYNSGISAPQTVADSMARMRSAQAYHRDSQGWGDIGYSWCVDDLGNIYEGRGWWKTGAHTFGYNSKGYGICWLGDSEVSMPSDAALRAIASVIQMGIAEGTIAPNPAIVAHRDRVPDTVCCGDPMYEVLPTIRALVNGGAIPVPAGDDDLTPEEKQKLDDMYRMAVQVHGVLANPMPGWNRPPSINDLFAYLGDKHAAYEAQINALRTELAELKRTGVTPTDPISPHEVAAQLLAQLIEKATKG